MKKLFYLLIATIVLISCGNGSKNKTETSIAKENQTNRVEVLYFHGAQRCITCRAIEANTVALLDSLYSKEQADGKIIFKVIDISKKENEQIADKYEVTWSSLFVNAIMEHFPLKIANAFVPDQVVTQEMNRINLKRE